MVYRYEFLEPQWSSMVYWYEFLKPQWSSMVYWYEFLEPQWSSLVQKSNTCLSIIFLPVYSLLYNVRSFCPLYNITERVIDSIWSTVIVCCYYPPQQHTRRATFLITSL